MHQRTKILIIDDDEGVRDTLAENLEVSGYEVIQAIDGAQGLLMIDPEDLPQIVITDIIMPRQEGLETIIAIRKLYPSIKIIAMSGGGRAKAMDFLGLAQRLGAEIIMAKPVDIDGLERVIKSLIG